MKKRSQIIAEALADFSPKVSGTGTYTRSNSSTNVGDPTVPAAGLSSITSDQLSVGVTASQNIFNGFADSAKVEQTDAAIDSARGAMATVSAQLRIDLKTAFARVIYQQQLMNLNKDIVSRRLGNEELVQLMFEGGKENKGNFLRARASHHSADVDYNQAERGLRVARQNFARLLGRPAGTEVGAEGKLVAAKAPAAEPDFSAIANTLPTHRQFEADRRVAEAGISRSRAGFFPTLGLNGSVAKTGDKFPLDTDRWSVGVTLTIPVFSGGSTFFDLQSSISERNRAEANLRKADLQNSVTLEQSYLDLKTSVERAIVQEESVRAAEMRSEIARGKYTNGLQTFQEWDQIETDLINQQQQLLSNRFQSIVAEATWEQAQGMGVKP